MKPSSDLLQQLLGALLAFYSISVHASPVYFSPDQVRAGKELYLEHCASCHAADLSGAGAAALKGKVFLNRWTRGDQTLGDLIFTNRSSMPLGNAGILSKQEYFDISVYLLTENGHPVGTESLAMDDAAVETIKVGQFNKDFDPQVHNQQCPDVNYLDQDQDPADWGPSDAELKNSENDHQWLLPSKGYSGQRYSTLSQITKENVSQLQAVCAYDSGDMDPMQSYLGMHNDRLYFASNHSTFAVDAANCKLIWRYDRKSRCDEIWGRARGVGLKNGILIRGTPDGYLLALNAKTGERIWERRVSDTTSGGGGLSMPALIYDDLVFMGPAPTEVGLKGWVKAFNIYSGELAWTFNVVPEPGQPGADTWGSDESLIRGGGGVWTPFTVDVETSTLYLASGNPSPAYYDDDRPGKNLYTNAAIALDAHTGKLKWYRQFTPEDFHDWDLNHASPIITINESGQERQLLIVAGKDGFIHGVDRKSTDVLYSTELSRQVNTRVKTTTDNDTRFCPGLYGGTQWNGPAFSPVTKSIYVNTMEWCASLRKTDEIRYVFGGFYIGGMFKMDPYETAYANLTSMDALTGRINWRYKSKQLMTAAVTVTASNLVMSGEIEGNFFILDADNGSKLFDYNLGESLGAGIITYAVNGRQYIAVASGTASPIWYQKPASAKIHLFALP